MIVEGGQRVFTIRHENWLESLIPQDDAEHLGEGRIVVNYQHAGSHAVQYRTCVASRKIAPHQPGSGRVDIRTPGQNRGMRATLPLGRWFGVPVGANAGVLVILLLVGLLLGIWHFPTVYPGRAVWAYLLAGSAAAILLVGSILLHELSHAVVAQANGVKVDRIVLWLLGGVAQLRDEPRTAGADLAVAVVGPATSLVLGGLFGAAAVTWLALVGEGLVVATLAYL